MSREPCLRLPTKLAPWNCILGSWFGSNFETCFGSIFGLGPALGPHDFVFNSWAPKRYLKIDPKQGPKLDPNQDPKTQSRGANCVGRHRQGSCRHDLQSVVCSAISFNCLQQTKNFNQRTKRKLGPTNLLKRTACVRLQASIVKTWPPCRRYTVQFHTWENQQQHACYSTITMENAWKCCGKWTFIVLLCWFTHENCVIFHRHVGLPEGKFGIHECQWCDQQKKQLWRHSGWVFWIFVGAFVVADGFPVFQASQAQPSKAMPMIVRAAPSVCQPRALRVWWVLAAPKVPGLAAAWWNSWCPGWTRWLCWNMLKYVEICWNWSVLLHSFVSFDL